MRKRGIKKNILFFLSLLPLTIGIFFLHSTLIHPWSFPAGNYCIRFRSTQGTGFLKRASEEKKDVILKISISSFPPVVL
jgi:hypothetical protein